MRRARRATLPKWRLGDSSIGSGRNGQSDARATRWVDGQQTEGEERPPASKASPGSRPPAGVEKQGGLMATKDDEPWVGMTTRIPKDLRYRIKVYCATHDVPVMNFVAEAIAEKLRRKPVPKKGTTS